MGKTANKKCAMQKKCVQTLAKSDFLEYNVREAERARRFFKKIYALRKEQKWTLFQTEVGNNSRKFRCAFWNGFSLR